MSRAARSFQAKVKAKAEASLALHAVWCIGPKQGAWSKPGQNAPAYPMLFGASKDPDEILRQARKWNWVSIDMLAVVWVGSQTDAEALVDELHDIVDEAACVITKTVFDDATGTYVEVKSRWLDFNPDLIEEAIRTAATGADVEIFDAQTRQEKLRQQIRREIEKLKRR